MNQAIAHSANIFRGSARREGNQLSVRGPDGNSHHLVWVLFKSNLPSLAAAQGQHPDIAVTAAVGEINKFVVGGIRAGGLHLSGLIGDAYPATHIACRIPVHRKLPNVELHVLPADHNAAITIYIRIFVAGFSKSKLAGFAS